MGTITPACLCLGSPLDLIISGPPPMATDLCSSHIYLFEECLWPIKWKTAVVICHDAFMWATQTPQDENLELNFRSNATFMFLM